MGQDDRGELLRRVMDQFDKLSFQNFRVVPYHRPVFVKMLRILEHPEHVVSEGLEIFVARSIVSHIDVVHCDRLRDDLVVRFPASLIGEGPELFDQLSPSTVGEPFEVFEHGLDPQAQLVEVDFRLGGGGRAGRLVRRGRGGGSVDRSGARPDLRGACVRGGWFGQQGLADGRCLGSSRGALELGLSLESRGGSRLGNDGDLG